MTRLLLIFAVCLLGQIVVRAQERVELPNGYWYEPGQLSETPCLDETCDRRGPLRTIIGNIHDRRQPGQQQPAGPIPQPYSPQPAQQPQVRIIPPASSPQPAGDSIYANPEAARASAMEDDLADARWQLEQAQAALADCVSANEEWKARFESLAVTAANQASQCNACEPSPANEEAEDPWYLRWAPTIAGAALGAAGVTLPWFVAPAWMGFKAVRRRRRRRAGEREAPAEIPFE